MTTTTTTMIQSACMSLLLLLTISHFPVIVSVLAFTTTTTVMFCERPFPPLRRCRSGKSVHHSHGHSHCQSCKIGRTYYYSSWLIRRQQVLHGSMMGSDEEDEGYEGSTMIVKDKEEEGTTTASKNEDFLEKIRSMRVKELKKELTKRKISTSDVFDKEELVKRLYDSRVASSSTIIQDQQQLDYDRDGTNNDIIRGDISFTSIETGRSISGTDLNSGESIRIKAEGTPYPTINIHVLDNNNNNNNIQSGGGGSEGFDLSLLFDTACSGFVLRPSIIIKYNMLAMSSSSSTMIGAAGTTNPITAGLSQINSFTIVGDRKKNVINNNGRPLPVAVQGIDALPTSLDGIIGLSFMNQFACTEIDISNSKVAFYKKESSPPLPPRIKLSDTDGVGDDSSLLEIVAEGNLSPTRLGIWTVDTMIDGRGPIRMLVDTGATSTFINWKGIEEGLGLSRNSFLVKELQQEMGAIGSDNIAMKLTHRYDVEHSINFINNSAGGGSGYGGKRENEQKQLHQDYDGLCLSPSSSSWSTTTTLPIDIGDIAILDVEQLSADGVVGILGMDVFLQCSMIRMNFNGINPKITLFKNKLRKINNSNSNSYDDSNSNSNKKNSTEVAVAVQTTEPTTTTKTENTKEKKRKKRRY